MLRTTLALSALVLPLAAAVPLALAKDITTVIPDKTMIAQTSQELAASKVTLAEAIAAVAKETGGAVSRAEFKQVGGKPVFEASAWGDGKAWTCIVDAATGAVTKNELPAYTFPGDPVTGPWVTTESGLRWTDLVVGSGPTPKSAKSTVRVHYTGWFLDGAEFDSSRKPRQPGGPVDPATFALGGVIKGWTEGVGSMKVGGKRKLLIPHGLAYGEGGRPGIPPRATLVFDVELIQITD